MEKIVELRLDEIEPDPGQPRKNKPKSYTDELGRSIWNNGQDNAIIVTRNKRGSDFKFKILNGECRHTACLTHPKLKKRGTILAIVRDCKDKTPAELFLAQIRDNDTRLNMGTMETIEAYGRALELGATITALVNAIGKTKATIEADLPLLNLPADIKKSVEAGTLPKEVARVIAELETDSRMATAYKHAIRGKGSAQMIANVRHYISQVYQEEINIFKEVTSDQLKGAGKVLDKLLSAVKVFANSSTGKGGLMIKARAKKGGGLSDIELTANEMKKQAEFILGNCRLYRASHAKAGKG